MKNQLKKSFSLFLAVLMILSCWVWVAPDKAEAGAPSSYDVTISFSVSNMINGGTAYADVYYIPNNGTGTETSKRFELDKLESTEGDYSITLSNIGGWPSRIYVRGHENGMTTFEFVVKGISINGRQVLKGTWTIKGGWNGDDSRDYIPNSRGNKTADGLSGTVSGTAEGEWNWPRPLFNAATATLSPASHTLAKINSNINSTSTISLSGFVDDYGVNWTGSVTSTFTLRVDDGVTPGQNATMTGSGNSRTITIKPWFQTLYPGKQNAKLYIDWTATGGSGTKTGTETITVDFPTYTVTFDANGGKIGNDDSEAKDQIVLEGDKMNIGSVIGKAPAYATKDGFEFKGFYSTQYADATGKTASFDESKKFVDNETIIPAATSGNGDTTWYAAWQALPITATFVTADNQLIGTVEGRYNNYMTASNMYNGDAGLNAAVKAAYTGSTVKFNNNSEPIYTDGSTNYNFDGWKIIRAYDESVVDGNEDTVLHGDVTFQAVYTKADAATYTVSFEDGNGNVISTKSDYKYREDVTNVPATDPTKAQDDMYSYEFIGWAKDIGKNFYAVDEYDNDENGARIAYTHKDGAEFIVKGDASYVPVFRMIPREYKVTYNYTADGSVAESTFIEGYHWNDTAKMPEIKDNYTSGGMRYYLTGWKVGDSTTVKQLDEIAVNGDLTLTAVYGNAEAAKYTINFYGKDADGETDVLLNADTNIYTHNSTVTAPEVPTNIDTEDSLYTFSGWSPSVNTTASGDVDYYATYTKKDYADLHFYNYDGTLIYELDGKEEGLFVGGTIPAYENLVEGENVLPVKEEDVVGTYNFTGWADGNGNEVIPGTDSFTGDTYLYAQFDTIYKDYTVKFVNEGTTVSEKKYHYGTEIEIPADPAKAADVEYIYDFKSWSPDVSAVCYGDATYEATYRRTPQYYKVTWLNDAKNVHTESNYQYNAKIQQAVINAPVSYAPAATGKTWAFSHWVQCDANGNDILDADGKQIIFTRGQRMGSEHLYFYPVFVEQDNVLTVTFYKEDGTTLLGEAKIPYGGDIADYAEPFAAKAPKAPDEINHYKITNWINIVGGATVTTITADVSVKATYTAEPHDKQIYEVVAEPTCNVPGFAHYKCEADECTAIDYNVKIAPVADEGNPEGQIYVGTNKWTLENYTAGIDYADVKFVGPNTNVIVNAEDTGTRSMPWNLEGEMSRGVGTIDYYVSATKIDPLTVGDTLWTNVYDYEAYRTEALNEVLKENKLTLLDYNGYIRGTAEEQMKKAAIDREVDARLSIYNANATGVLSNLNLENGKTYIIYIRIADRAGNGEVNKCYLSSGTISYGTTAPEIAIAGEGYGTKFCADATITVSDDTDGYTVYLDGEAVTLTDGKYVCTDMGLHTVTVIDKNGNKTSKTFEIKGSHTFRNYTTAATCENAGSRYDLCTLCGFKANIETLPAFGHSYTVNFVDKAADCINDGYRTYVCDNNCGTTIVIKPTDDAATIAQAKKWDETAGEDGKGAWVALAAADLASLKATGVHTYEKVKDENGEDTAEDAWVIDKAATCITEGAKHRDCTKCGETEEATIPVDTKDGHKFYREKVTLEPTCTTKGEKTKTCRYCGTIEKVSDIDALGHTAGEYRVITPATCETAGSQILTCAVCGVEIGEPVKDAEGKVTGYDGKSVVIAKLEHAWKISGAVYEEDGKYYQNYVCKNDSTHTKREEVEDYEPPVAATVTFDFNGGSYTVPAVGNPNEFGYQPEMLKGTQTISTYVGESIAASEVEKAFKQNNATKTYSFAYWATKNADGTYTEVKFPIEVKGDATYYAVYNEKFVNYTITYYKEDGTTEYKKTGYLHNGDVVELADGPAKAETSLKKSVFAGWKVTTGDTVYTDTVTIDGANINLKATYTEVKKQYAVTYAYSSNNIIHTYIVEAGKVAPDARDDFEVEKGYDTKYHYEFKAWNRAAQLASVESNIYTTPDFTPVAHVYTVTEKSAATCTANRVVTNTCSCGYSYDEEEANTALGHLMGDPVYDEETGTNTATCERENCGATEEDTRSFTVKFYVESDTPIKTISYIKWGKTIDATRLPATPSKESTATTDYTFKGWAVEGTTDIIDFAEFEIKQDYNLVAVFDGTARIYSVVFAYDAHNIIKTIPNVEAGKDLEVTFDKTPEKAFDATYHYTFNGWVGYTEGALNITVEDVQGDLYILADFAKAKHTYTESSLGAPTCTNGSGTRYTCTCGKYYDVAGKPLDHDFVEVDRKEATANNDGFVKYECTVCGTTKTEVLKYNDNTMEIKVYVEHNGAPESGVKVEIQNAVDGSVVFATTNANGYAVFTVDQDGAYTCYVENDGKHQVTLVKEGKGYVGTYSYTDQAGCTCACHRNNIWGAIFRFFHKIIKLFTGEFKCCGNPDPMYN